MFSHGDWKSSSVLCYPNVHFCGQGTDSCGKLAPPLWLHGGIRDGSKLRVLVRDSVDFRRNSTLRELPPSEARLMEVPSREVAFMHWWKFVFLGNSFYSNPKSSQQQCGWSDSSDWNSTLKGAWLGPWSAHQECSVCTWGCNFWILIALVGLWLNTNFNFFQINHHLRRMSTCSIYFKESRKANSHEDWSHSFVDSCGKLAPPLWLILTTHSRNHLEARRVEWCIPVILEHYRLRLKNVIAKATHQIQASEATEW